MTVHIFSPPIETMTVGEHCAIITTYCDEGLGPWLGLVWRGISNQLAVAAAQCPRHRGHSADR